MVLVGYIDESYSNENPPLTFGLSCVFTFGSEWTWVELAWKNLLEKKNNELVANGRKPLRRFHAVDMSNFAGDFEDWSSDERIAFTEQCLTKVFARHDLYALGYTVSLRDVAETWPNYAKKTREFAYYSLLKIILLELAPLIRERFGRGTEFSILHDRCACDGALQESFESARNDQKYALGEIFTSLMSTGWEECVPLQVADFFAYEVMKESHRLEPEVVKQKARSRRKSLELLLDVDSFYSAAKSVSRESLIRIRESITGKVAAKIAATSNGAV